VSKAGNRRVRTLLAKLGWLWLRFQPDSALNRWFGARGGGASARGASPVRHRRASCWWHRGVTSSAEQ